MFERYTEKARRAIFFARYEASQFGKNYIESEHLLLGLLREDRGLIALLRIPSEEGIRKKIEDRLGVNAEKPATTVDLPLNPECRRALSYAAEDAEKLGHQNIDTKHLVLGLLRLDGSGVVELLGENQMDHHRFFEIVREAPSSEPVVPFEVRPRKEPAPEPEPPTASALSLQLTATRLRNLLKTARPHLKAFSNADGAVRLKRKDWSRRQAMGHLIDWTATHHCWIARALTEPKVVVSGYPLDEWVSAQDYDTVNLEDLVRLWLELGQLVLHAVLRVPEGKLETPFRIGVDAPTMLRAVIVRYVDFCEELVAQVLMRS